MNYLGINLLARLPPRPYLAFQVQPEILERYGKNLYYTIGYSFFF